MSISVLLPFRNAAATLDAAIRSVAEQTHREWELFLIDNASTDESPGIAQSWCAQDTRIRLLHEPRVGIAHALNRGLAATTAPLIARMDADDVSHPERLARQVAFMRAHTDIGVLGTRTRFETTVAKSSGMRWFVDWQNRILSPEEHFVKRFVDAPVAHPTVIFRRELVDRFGGYNSGPLPEDHELWLRWMHHGARFAKLPEELLIWNDHPDRLSRTHPNYSTDAFFSTKARWLAKWLKESQRGKSIIIAGTSQLCQGRARTLGSQGIDITAFTDVKPRVVPGFAFVQHDALPTDGSSFIVSFISQRGTGDRIAAYFTSLGLVEGADFILAA